MYPAYYQKTLRPIHCSRSQTYRNQPRGQPLERQRPNHDLLRHAQNRSISQPSSQTRENVHRSKARHRHLTSIRPRPAQHAGGAHSQRRWCAPAVEDSQTSDVARAQKTTLHCRDANRAAVQPLRMHPHSIAAAPLFGEESVTTLEQLYPQSWVPALPHQKMKAGYNLIHSMP
jgi:hypothetical protein